MGQAKAESAIMTTNRGTRFYRDPEVLRGGLATQQADVYSLAIIMYELWFGFIVYSDVFAHRLTDIEAVEEEICQGERKPNLYVKGYRPPIPEWCKLLEDSWKDKPIDKTLVRMSSQDIYVELGRMLRMEFINEKVLPAIAEGFDSSLHVKNRKDEESAYFW
jgi:serine/threonine protein kinase